jgi:hypothetical protein
MVSASEPTLQSPSKTSRLADTCWKALELKALASKGDLPTQEKI